jgi:hypothetical protein
MFITATLRESTYPCNQGWREWSRFQDKRETTMVKFDRSYRKDQTASLLDDAALDAVVGGAMQNYLSPQFALAAHPVGGWTMKDIWAKPTLGTYH